MSSEELPWYRSKHCVSIFQISKALKDVSNILQSFKLMETKAFEIAGWTPPR